MASIGRIKPTNCKEIWSFISLETEGVVISQRPKGDMIRSSKAPGNVVWRLDRLPERRWSDLKVDLAIAEEEVGAIRPKCE